MQGREQTKRWGHTGLGGANAALALACPVNRVSGWVSLLSRASPGFFRPTLARALKNFPFCHFVTLNARAPAHPLPAIWRSLLHKTAAPAYPSKTRDRRRSPESSRAVTRGGGRPSSCLPTASFFHAPVRSPQPPPPISRRHARMAAMDAPRGGHGGLRLAAAGHGGRRGAGNALI